MAEITLYSYWRSSASFRVRIGLKLKKIPYEYRAVHLINDGGQQHSEAFRQLNPGREVPTLVHQGRVLGQSVAILLYLDEQFSTLSLFPKTSYERARVLQLCEILNSGVQPIHNLRVLQELEKRFGADQNAKDEWSSYWIRRGLDILEAELVQTAGTYCIGGAISAADAFLVPGVYNAHRYKISLAPYPNIERVYKNCMALEAVQAAAPEAQPDAPKS